MELDDFMDDEDELEMLETLDLLLKELLELILEEELMPDELLLDETLELLTILDLLLEDELLELMLEITEELSPEDKLELLDSSSLEIALELSSSDDREEEIAGGTDEMANDDREEDFEDLEDLDELELLVVTSSQEANQNKHTKEMKNDTLFIDFPPFLYRTLILLLTHLKPRF